MNSENELLFEVYSKIKESYPDDQFESFDVVKSVDKHRRYWKPDNVKTVLLAESHVYTEEDDFSIKINYPKDIDVLKNCPNDFVKLVYCLGYGESEILIEEIDKRNDGTTQFWKIFSACVNDSIHDYNFSKILKGSTKFNERIQNKVELLLKMKEQGIWLLDASIVALYDNGIKPPPSQMKSLINISWEYIRQCILEEEPKQIIVIGKGAYKELEGNLRAFKDALGINIKVISQPQGLRSKEKIKEAHSNYHEWCRNIS